MRLGLVLLAVLALIAPSMADVYFHSPRGANDRCDEKSNNRNNANRCWDSENNAAGGYGICDKEMVFYEDTVMRIEFYTQHNCGNGASVKTDPTNPEAVHCMHVIQLGCDWAFQQYAGSETNYRLTDGLSLGRPGADAANTINADSDKFNTFGDTCTQTKPTNATCQDPTNSQAQCATLNLADGGSRSTFNSAACQCHPRKMQTYCYHEPEAYYDKCKTRERNKGLFAADQNVNNNNGATRTRQEPNSARYGFECVEERDYWPYWHPSPWIDLVVFVSDTTTCSFLQSESQNVKDKCECVNSDPTASPTDQMAAWAFNQQLSCTTAGYTWNCTGNNFNRKAPDCLLAPHQPDNSLARTDVRGANSQKTDGSRLAHYDWTVDGTLIPKGQDETRCLLRLRYNISTAETPADFDQNDNYKLSTNPVNTFGSGNSTGIANDTMPIRMAVNTAQFGRVFQDRTWSFVIRHRTSDLKGKTIHNVNVRGKRGNIAQVRNCFEYDFVPLILNANVGDLVFFQWCLTDYNDDGNAGEGRAGTDRANVIPITQYDQNIIQSLNATNTIFSQADLAALAWLGQDPQYCYSTQQMLTTQKNSANDPMSCHFLNGVRDENGMPTAYFGYMARVIKTGSMYFISSRNNNFTNRSQKATINIGTSSASAGVIAGAVIGSVVGVAAIAGIGFFAVKKGGLSFGASKV